MPIDERSAADESNGGREQDRPTLQSIWDTVEALKGEPKLPQEEDRDERIYREQMLQLDLERGRTETDLIQARIDDLRLTQKLREKYAGRVHRLLIWWVSIAISLLVLDALDPPTALNDTPFVSWVVPAFDIEKQVMLTFLGGTTIAVVGLVLAVVKGLFPPPPKN